MVVDAEAAVRAWINSRTADLVGVGHPLQLGAHLNRPRSPGRGAYAWLSRVGGTPGLTAETPVDLARISAAIYAPTKESAANAAVAYANALHALHVGAGRTVMGDAVCVAVDSISGPLWVDDSEGNHEQYRYLVDAEFALVDPAFV